MATIFRKENNISFGNKEATMPNTMTAKQIKQLRKKLNLTGDELAEMLGVTGNTVRRWECGAREARGPVVHLLERLEKDADEKSLQLA